MSDTGRDSNLIPDDAQANYRRMRADRGWSWEEMAEEFDRQAIGLAAGAARSYVQLATWARDQQAPGAPEPVGAPAPVRRKGPERDTRQPAPARTA